MCIGGALPLTYDARVADAHVIDGHAQCVVVVGEVLADGRVAGDVAGIVELTTGLLPVLDFQRYKVLLTHICCEVSPHIPDDLPLFLALVQYLRVDLHYFVLGLLQFLLSLVEFVKLVVAQIHPYSPFEFLMKLMALQFKVLERKTVEVIFLPLILRLCVFLWVTSC